MDAHEPDQDQPELPDQAQPVDDVAPQAPAELPATEPAQEPPEPPEPIEPPLTKYQAETELRIEFCKRLLITAIKKGGMNKRDMKMAVMREFQVAPRTYEKYIAEARKRYRAEQDDTTDNLLSDSLGFYEGIVSNPRERTSDRLRARERLDRLHGLEKPIKHEHGGKVGVQHTNMVDAAAQIRLHLFEHPEQGLPVPALTPAPPPAIPATNGEASTNGHAAG